MLSRLVLLAVLSSGPPASADERENLHLVSSPHFNVYCESFYPPTGILSDLEGLHAKLMLDLILFAPWAKDEKIEIFLYKSSATYQEQTHAGPWTGGYAEPARRRIYTFESDQLRRVLAHEMAHLFFDDFFASKDVTAASGTAAAKSRAHPPLWLSEGVAVLMEWDYGLEKNHPYLQTRLKTHREPLESFLAFDYRHDVHETQMISDWYAQAYSLVRFLMRTASPGEFFAFCDHLRNGLPMDEALLHAYGSRFPDIQTLEKRWQESLQEK